MRSVNRSVAVVRPREPYVKWATSVDADVKDFEEDARAHVSVYLIPPDPKEEQEAAPMSQWFAQIFESELEGWYLDEESWPQQRDLKTFQEWFEVAVTSVVTDLVEGAVLHEEW